MRGRAHRTDGPLFVFPGGTCDSSAGAERSAHAPQRDVEKTCDKHAAGCRLFKALVGDVATHDRHVTGRLTPSPKLIEILSK